MTFTYYIRKMRSKDTFLRPRLDVTLLDKGEDRLIAYVQRNAYGLVIEKLSKSSPFASRK